MKMTYSLVSKHIAMSSGDVEKVFFCQSVFAVLIKIKVEHTVCMLHCGLIVESLVSS